MVCENGSVLLLFRRVINVISYICVLFSVLLSKWKLLVCFACE